MKRLVKTAASVSLMMVFGITAACDLSNHDRPDDIIEVQPHSTTEDTVVISKDDIALVKMDRYQPSLELAGRLIATNQLTLAYNEKAALTSLYVTPSSIAKKDDKLADFITPNGDVITLNAPFDGIVDKIYQSPSSDVLPSNTPILQLSDVASFEFISQIPAHLSHYFVIGNLVTFVIDKEQFSGQITQVHPSADNPELLDISVNILPEAADKISLMNGKTTKGRFEFGQIQVGALLPDFAIFGDDLNTANLSHLKTPPYHSELPLPVFVWVIKQDHRLSLSKAHVIKYQPNTGRFLVTGITDDSLVVQKRLPKSADGSLIEIR
ncbi:hypothetical protein LU293_06510 [Moraxella nasovis]|uniref:hypothetical protein n=1 Tax=Moraxella nasovis TaxID=2904121 RepID=UPI001F60B1D8|nr:hypothetical protein [Moraxella nasovis]UNU72761.1 hypothetical protein LU293_06510 [Moraxella nasovis]